ncbi:type III-B CRISPR module RAMP protein Cmr1 [Herpetosiphon gulosus]|uniref:CRISPR type III-associated protein domain-containing protein n=1 Tax=Herpetosiphon gulosus TaxID=1973496 RepID=A0ABP9WZW1_9CHLR
MNRKPTISAPDPIEYQAPNEFTIGGQTYITETRSYKLITPLFGGGVEAGVNDPITRIRASGIRGQLRFWWRAIRGGSTDPNFTDSQRLDDMRQREAEIWGSASTSSSSEKKKVNQDSSNLVDDQNQENNKLKNIIPIQISVEIISDGEEQKPYEIRMTKGKFNAYGLSEVAHEYASFPIKPDRETVKKYGMQTPIKTIRNEVIFNLKITYHKGIKIEVDATLWAWETFGGIGGRTRRGFGSVTRCDNKEHPKNANNFKSWLLGNYTKYYKNTYFHPDLPILGDISNSNRFKIFYKTGKQGLFGMWRDLIEKLKYFRQAKNTNGTSLWPEPNQIRRITKQHLKHHNPDNVQASPQYKIIKAFPRAQFGLPIIFQFKGNRYGSNRKDLDPRPTTLGLVNPNDSTKDNERLASPLILKTFQCANGDLIGLAFILSGTELSPKMKLSLKASVHPISPKPEDLRFLLRADEVLNINSISVEGNILEAFLAYLKEKMPK